MIIVPFHTKCSNINFEIITGSNFVENCCILMFDTDLIIILFFYVKKIMMVKVKTYILNILITLVKEILWILKINAPTLNNDQSIYIARMINSAYYVNFFKWNKGIYDNLCFDLWVQSDFSKSKILWILESLQNKNHF